VFDLDAYLARIGLRGRPTIAEMHRAHVSSIPFENLDPASGRAVSLEPDDLERKLVHDRRGGYCFEHNLLFKAALEALGAEVEPILARVGERGTERSRTHLLLRVRAGDAVWHADTGFGRGTLLEPIPFGPGAEHVQEDWRFRVIADGPELVLQTVTDGEWVDGYTFVPEAAPFIDIETSNWYTATHPRSPFVSAGISATIYDREATAISLSNWSGSLILTELTPAQRTVTPVAPARAGELLATRFGLPGWALSDDGRLIAQAVPASLR
jgi:N-hydroxyarylamine O-acetyltransferase